MFQNPYGDAYLLSPESFVPESTQGSQLKLEYNTTANGD